MSIRAVTAFVISHHLPLFGSLVAELRFIRKLIMNLSLFGIPSILEERREVSKLTQIIPPQTTVSYFEIVFSVLTGFLVILSANLAGSRNYLGIKEMRTKAKGNKSTEVFSMHVKIRNGHNVYLRRSQNNGTKNQIEKKAHDLGTR